MNTYIQQQVYGQLLFQEDRLILKFSSLAFNIVENWKKKNNHKKSKKQLMTLKWLITVKETKKGLWTTEVELG